MTSRVVVLWSLLILVPMCASAQQVAGAIAGQVRDTTGAVLPGVTVEASSPALIEKVRTAVTDDTGQYRIVDLRPGVYAVMFTLTGFSTVRHEELTLTTGFTATVDAELAVGDISETITVSGQAPVVDVQNVTQQTVFSRTVLDVVPSGRMYSSIGTLIPGMSTPSSFGDQDVGGAVGRDSHSLTIHGSRADDFRLMIDGMPVGGWMSENGSNVAIPPADSIAEEVNLQIGAFSAEVETGGPQMNLVPKSGGNLFQGSVFGNFATTGMQGDNLTDDLRARGLAASGKIDYLTDFNPSFGGPVKRDRLWFFVSYRDARPMRFSTLYPDKDVSDWVYTPDPSKPLTRDERPQWNLNGRMTWQASPRNRIGSGIEVAYICQCWFGVGSSIGSTRTPEGTPRMTIWHEPLWQISWTSPLTNRLLLEAGGQIYRGHWRGRPQTVSVPPAAQELSNGILFRSSLTLGSTGYTDITWESDYVRGAVSYTTGVHSFKTGATLWPAWAQFADQSFGHGPYTLQLLNAVPRAVVYRMDPIVSKNRQMKAAAFAQDQWTIQQLTMNLGLRLDVLHTGYPAQHLDATAYLPARDFPAGDVHSWWDLQPRLSVAYDLFGNAKTAVKASIGRYTYGDGANSANAANPARASGGTLTRTWTDVNGDYIPQGDPANPNPNGELTGASPNRNWGTPIFTTRFDPEWAQGGRGARMYNWETSASIQHQLISNMSVNVAYFRRRYGNLTVTDNLALGPGDFDSFCITAPRDSRLPGGGGQEICGLLDVKPAKFGQTNNLVTLASNYGQMEQRFDGVDVTVNARFSQGFVLQGGTSLGKGITDDCDLLDELPELLVSGNTRSPESYCRAEQPYQTQVKLLATYALPWALDVAATYQNASNPMSSSGRNVNSPPMGLRADYLVGNAAIAPSLGRNLSAGATTLITVNVLPPGSIFGDRIQQLDLRFGRTFRFGRTSVKAMVDLYNVTNSNTVRTLNHSYGTNGAFWQQPLNITSPRLLKLGAQMNF